MTVGLPLEESVLTPLTKCVLISLGLSVGKSAADPTFWKKICGSCTTALINPNESIEDIMKIGLLIQRISKRIKNKTKEQKGSLISMLLGTLAASLLGSALTGKGLIRGVECTIRADENF